MRKAAWIGSALLLLCVASASAQAPVGKSVPCVNPETNVSRQKALQCTAAFRQQGLRGDDLINNTAVCVAEARLFCLKKAAADKIHTPMRSQYLATCMAT